MKGQTEGRIVHYVISGHEYPGAERAAGQHRPMLIVKSWSPGYVNGQVFLDGSNDGAQGHLTAWVTSTYESAEKLPGTWHEIERVD